MNLALSAMGTNWNFLTRIEMSANGKKTVKQSAHVIGAVNDQPRIFRKIYRSEGVVLLLSLVVYLNDCFWGNQKK